jgi:hypothetical protein
MRGRGMGGNWTEWEWFKLSQGQWVNNLHTFAIEKKAQMLNLKCNIKTYMFPILACLSLRVNDLGQADPGQGKTAVRDN